MSSAAVSPELFRRACALFPTGVAVLTTRASDGTPHGLTINAFCSLSLNPPLVLVADRPGLRLPGNVRKCRPFCRQFPVSRATPSLRSDSPNCPKAASPEYPGSPAAEGAPLLEGAIGSIECRTSEVIDAGDHRALIGEVIGASVGEGDPLVFFRSGYRLKWPSPLRNGLSVDLLLSTHFQPAIHLARVNRPPQRTQRPANAIVHSKPCVSLRTTR